MNYQYARGRNKRRVSMVVVVVLSLMALAGCTLVVAGLVDYGVGKLEQLAVEAVVNYVAPAPGAGTYELGPTMYEKLHKDWRSRVVSKIAMDEWYERVTVAKILIEQDQMKIGMDQVPYLCRWSI
jgi:hypothetical protein